MSEIPKEFEWIVPGVKAFRKDWPGECKIKFKPYFNPVWGWCAVVEENKIPQRCSDLTPLYDESKITLTLTREKAENCHTMLGDALNFGPSETLEWLRKQIEEALK